MGKRKVEREREYCKEDERMTSVFNVLSPKKEMSQEGRGRASA